MVLRQHSFKDLDAHISLNHYTKTKRITIIKLMENNNGTVTISLETYHGMIELIADQNERINELANAHSVVIDMRNPTGKIVGLGNKQEYTWYDQVTFQIKGSLTETNEAFQALRNELDELHARGNDHEVQYIDAIAERDRTIKNLKHKIDLTSLNEYGKHNKHWWNRLI
jgi:hypothetical protein